MNPTAEACGAVAAAVLRGDVGPEDWPVDTCDDAVDHRPIRAGGRWVVRVAPNREYACGVECCGYEYIGSRIVPDGLIPDPESEEASR